MMTHNPEPRTYAWLKGDLSYKLRPHGQSEVYRWIKQWQEIHPGDPGPLLLNCHRRFGKSYVAYLIGTERAISKPRQRVRIYTPTKEQGIDIADEQWSDLLEDRPASIGWDPCVGDVRVFNPAWKNGKAKPETDYSLIGLHGTEVKSGNPSRGVGAHLIIMDECQMMRDFERLLQRVVGWQVLKKKGALVLMLFTPCPERHILKEKYIPQAIREGRYFEMPISKDKDVTDEDVQIVEKLVGSRKSIGFLLEGECCWQLGDPGNLVCPEWGYYRNQCQNEGRPFDLVFDGKWDMPEYYFPITTIDWAYKGFTACLFQFWDPIKKLWVVLRELWVRGKTAPAKKDMILATEREVFAGCKHPVMRWGDLSDQTKADLQTLFGFTITCADKTEGDAAIAGMNASIAAGEIRIHSSCHALLHQLEYGCYDRNDYQGKNYSRYLRDLTERPDNLLGDCDALDALRYGWKVIRRFRKEKPNPSEGTWLGDQFLPDENEDESDLGQLIEDQVIVL